jgi:16S rRNA (guanine1207-N2)-methyltransferase
MTTDHYFSPNPNSAGPEREVTFMIEGRVYRLIAAGGVFSADRLDPGTAVLLRKAVLPGPRGGTFLDLGCGYGPIACVLAATSEQARVYALDVNMRALELVRRNAESAGLADRISAVTAVDIPGDLEFDEIWSNPPIRIGKTEPRALLETWLPRLARGGCAWLVVAKHLGADSLQAWMERGGWQVERHAAQKGYRILKVDRPDPSS